MREEHLALARDAGDERPQMEFVKVVSLASSNMSGKIGRNTGSNTRETHTHYRMSGNVGRSAGSNTRETYTHYRMSGKIGRNTGSNTRETLTHYHSALTRGVFFGKTNNTMMQGMQGMQGIIQCADASYLSFWQGGIPENDYVFLLSHELVCKPKINA